jgi:hypothetical protein
MHNASGSLTCIAALIFCCMMSLDHTMLRVEEMLIAMSLVTAAALISKIANTASRTIAYTTMRSTTPQLAFMSLTQHSPSTEH